MNASKTLRSLGEIVVLALTLILLAQSASAATEYFNGGGIAQGWSSSSSNWSLISGGPYNTAWGTYNDAVFEGTSGTVTGTGLGVNSLTFNANGYLINGSLTLGSPTGGPSFNVYAGDTATINASLAHTTYTGWNVNGAGTLIFTGTDTTATAIGLNVGTLIFGSGEVLGTNNNYTGTIADNAALVFNAANNQTFGGVISGAGSLTSSAAGTLTLAAADTFSGAMTISAGTVALAPGGSLNNSSLITVGSGAALYLNGSANNQLQSGLSSGGGALAISGLLDVTTNTAHTLYASSITLSGGTMSSVANTTGYGAFYVNANKTITASGSGNVINAQNIGIIGSATLTLNTPFATDSLISSTQFFNQTAGASLAKSGLGTVALTGTNTYTGSTTIAGGGTLKLDFSAAGAPASNILYNGVTAGAVTLGGNLVVQGAATGASSQTLGALALVGGGLTVANSGANTTLTFASLTRGPGALSVDLSSGAGTNQLAFTSTTGIPAAGTAIGWATVTDATGIGFGTLSGNDIVRYTTATTALGSTANSSTTDFTTNPGTDTGGGQYSGGVLTMAGGTRALNTLAINTATSGGTLNLGGGTTALTTGGLLITGGNNFAITNGQLGGAATETDISVLGTGALTISTSIGSGAGSLVKGGPGTLYLNGPIGYTGTTSLGGGTTIFGTAGAQTVAGALVGGGALLKTGANTLTLNGASNNYSGTITVSQGTLAIGNNNAVGTSTNVVLGDVNSGTTNPSISVGLGSPGPTINNLTVGSGVTGARFIATGSSPYFTINGTTTLSSSFSIIGAGGNASYEWNGPITGNGAGSGKSTLLVNNPWYWQADSTTPDTFLGNVEITAGTVKLQTFSPANPAGNDIFPVGCMLIVDNGATFGLNNASANFVQTVDGLSGAGTISRLYNFTMALTINANNNSNQGNRVFNGTLASSFFTSALIMTGTGTQEFLGSNVTFNNGVNLNNGTLELADATGWASNIAVGTSVGTTPTLQLATTGSSDAWTFADQITGGTTGASIVASGPGTVILKPTSGSTFVGSGTGAITINSGKLILGSSFSTAPAVSVAGGTFVDNASGGVSTGAIALATGTTLSGSGSVGAATFAGSGSVVGGYNGVGSLTAASLILAGTTNLSGALGTSATSAAPIIITNALTTAGSNTVNVNISNTPSMAGTYHYLQFGSLPSPEGYSAFQFPSPVRAYTLVTSDPGYLDINYNPTNYPIWTGTNSSNFTGGNNWKVSSNGAVTDFLSLDTVVFDDSAGSNGGSTAININANVNPGSTTFNNNAYNYTLSGTGAITNGSLAMNGSGLLTISNTNTFSGAVSLNGGTIAVATLLNSGVAQPLGEGGALNFNGGRLEYTGPSASTNSTFVLGTGGGAVQIDSAATTLTLSTALSGTGAMTKNGPGSLTLSSTTATPIQIVSGTLNLPNAVNSNAIAVNGGTLNLTGGNINGALSGNGTITLNNGSTTMNFGSGTADTTANTFSGTTIINGYHVVLNKAANTPALGGNIILNTGYWAYHDMYPVSNNVFAAGTTLNFQTTNSTLYEFHLNGFNETVAGINCSNTFAIFENAGYEGGNDNNIPAATLTLNGTGTYSYNASLRDENNGSGNGALSLVMQGPGTQVLSGAGIGGTTGGVESSSGYSGSTTISGGVLRFNLTNALPGGPMTLSGGVLELQSPANLTLSLGATNSQIQLTGGTTGFSAYGAPVNVILNNNAFSTVQFGSTYFNPAALVLNAPTANNTINFQNQLDLNGAQRYVNVYANVATISGAIGDSSVSGTGGLSKGGSGTLVLTNYNTYAGPTTVNGGKLYVNGALNTASPITVSSAGILGGQGSAGAATVNAGGTIEGGQGGAGTFSLTSLTFNGSGAINLTPAAQPYVPLSISAFNGLTANGAAGSIDINLAGGNPGAGIYHLIEYSGSIQGTGTSAFQVSTAVGHNVYSLLDDPGYLDLSVTLNPITWTGSASTSWDTLASNWLLSSNSSSTAFIAGDVVNFDDTAAQTTVTISSGDVTPSSVTFNNNSKSYTLTGTNGITGDTGLTMGGSGLLTISNTNSFTGAVTLGGGTIAVPTMANGGTNSPLGSGTSLIFSGGALEYTSTASSTSNRTLTLNSTAPISVDSPVATLTLTGSLAGSAAIVKYGAGNLTLSGSNPGYAGAITVSQGTLTFATANAVGPATSVVLGDANSTANPTLYYNGVAPAIASLTVGENVTGATILVSPAGPFVTINGVTTLGSSLTFNQLAGSYFSALQQNDKLTGNGGGAGNDSLVFKDAISGGYQTYWQANNTVANDFLGNVHIMTGSVRLQGNGGNVIIPDTATLIIDSGAQLLTNIGGLTESFDGLSGGGTLGPYNNTSATFTIGANNGSATFSGAIVSAASIIKTGTGTQVLGSLASVTTASSTFTGGVTVNEGALVVAALSNGTTYTALGAASSSRTITANAGGTLVFDAPNVFGGYNAASSVPTLNINGGLVTNADPAGSNAINNALGNVNLTGGTLAATVGNHSGYAAWNLNGTVTSNGNSFITTSDTANGTMMLGDAGSGPFATTFNVQSGTLTIAAPLVQDNPDGRVNGLNLTGYGMLVLSASNAYGGGTYVGGGTLLLGNSAALGYCTGALTVNYGTLDLSGYSPHVASLAGASGVVTNSGSSLATLHVVGPTATTYYGTLQDGASPVGLAIDGGSLTVGGNLSNSGPTIINSGALTAYYANVLSANSAVTLSNGLLDVSAGAQTVAALSISNSGLLNVGIGNTLTSQGMTHFGGTLNIFGSPTGVDDLISYPNVTYAGSNGAFTMVDLNGAPLSGYALQYNANELDLVLTGPPTWSWSSIGGGSWSTSSNWSSNSVPLGQGVVAILGSAALTPATVTLDGAQTLGSLTFNNSNGYSLTPGSAGSLTMDNTGGTANAAIVVLSGTHSIAASLTLAGTNTSIALSSGGNLGISGNILDGASGIAALTLSSSDGTGQLTLSGTNSFGGGMFVNSGTLILNGAESLLAGSSLTIGSGSSPGAAFAPPATSIASLPNLAPVPEPGTFALLAVGALCGVILLWKRRRVIGSST